jgi:Arc/MetJ family transcription regulator
MSTHIDIDNDLLNEAVVLGHFRTKRAAVNAALAEFVRSRKRRQIINLFGEIDFDPSYDYKAERQR